MQDWELEAGVEHEWQSKAVVPEKGPLMNLRASESRFQVHVDVILIKHTRTAKVAPQHEHILSQWLRSDAAELDSTYKDEVAPVGSRSSHGLAGTVRTSWVISASVMALVDYPDSESESEPVFTQPLKASEKEETSRKRKREEQGLSSNKPAKLPPLPSSFHSLYTTNVRVSTSDDPELHSGRKRQIPHIEGNWPTHVYLEWCPSKTELAILEHLISDANSALTTTSTNEARKIHSLLQSELGAQLPLHISLSAPLCLQTDQRAEFEDRLEGAVKAANIHCFESTCTGLDWVPNFDKSRFFLVLRLSPPKHDELNRLLQLSNECAETSGLPLLYDYKARETSTVKSSTKSRSSAVDRSSAFHISIAWQLYEPSSSERVRIAAVDETELQGMTIWFDNVKNKIGNTVKNISLVGSIT